MTEKYWEIPDNQLALQIEKLSKFYNGETQNIALDNISLNIPVGSIFGLLGPNGAGKSTLINIISGAIFKTSGKVFIWGLDIDKYRKQSKLAVGVVPQELNIDAFFTPKETLNLHSGMFNVPRDSWRTDELLELMELTDKAETYSRKLSGGMRRRLLVAKAMVHSPPIVILESNDLVTIAPAATITLSPIVTPGSIIEFAPSQQFSPITIESSFSHSLRLEEL